MRAGEQTALERVRVFCDENDLLTPPADNRPLRVAAAVSGGADSMALLHLLRELQQERGFTLLVCHVNHGLRGVSADRDEAFVRKQCALLGVECRVFRPADLGSDWEPPPHAGEDWARRLRYACFERLLAEDTDRVATAHTANDQAETLLFRLARGTGLHGAGGIRPARGSFCRPLLCLSRADTEAVCRDVGQLWVEDETNAKDEYARNRLRHTALPALTLVNEAAVRNLARFCEKAARADAYFERQAENLLASACITRPDALSAGARYAYGAGRPVWSLTVLQTADELILEAAMHRLTAPVRDTEEKYIRLLCDLVRQGEGAVQLTEEVRLCAGSGFFWQEVKPACCLPKESFNADFFPRDGLEYPLPDGTVLKLAVFEEKTQRVHKKDLKNQADYARITTLYPALALRFRQPGDRFRPAGRGVSRPLRKWMNEMGIPPDQRSSLPLLAAGSEVVWVRGFGFADGLAPTGESTRIMQLLLTGREELSSWV